MGREQNQGQASGEPMWLIDPKQSRFGYWFIYGCGVLQIFAAVALVTTGQAATEYALAAVITFSALLFLSVARIVGARKGGIAFFAGDDVVAAFGTGEKDRTDFPKAGFRGVALERRREQWGKSEDPVFVWSVHLPTSAGVSLLLLELPATESANEAALAMRHALKLPILKDGDCRSRPQPDGRLAAQGLDVKPGVEEVIEFSQGAHWSLSMPVLLLALFSLVSGSLLLAGVAVTGVVGFLFGPILACLGLLLLGLWAFKALGTEKLVLAGEELRHSFRLSKFSWGARSLSADEPVSARLRTRGGLGFSLEVVAGGRMLIVGSGSTAASRTPPAALVQLGHHIACRYAEQGESGAEDDSV